MAIRVRGSASSGGGGRKRRKPKLKKGSTSSNRTRKRRGKSKKEQEHEEFLKDQRRKQREKKEFPTEPSVVANVKQTSAVMDKLRRASVERKRVEIMYKDRSSKLSRRRLEPYSLKYDPKGLKLYGFCMMRKATRSFFIKKIQDVIILAETFDPQYEITLEKDWMRIKGGKPKI